MTESSRPGTETSAAQQATRADERNRRLGALLWIVIRLLPFAALVCVAMIPVSFYATSRNDFCQSCHIMKPYYAAWQKSSHNKVDCLACHLPPGLAGHIEGKIAALSQLVKYATRTYGSRPWADVKDANCTACHAPTSLDKKPNRGKFKFVHGPHIEGAVREKNLKCTTCHTQLETDKHISVATQACYLCHFKPGPDGKLLAIAKCTTCHEPPDKKIEYQDTQVSHKDIVARGVDCTHCHSGVVEGNGSVARLRCQGCHADPEKLAKMSDHKLIHKAHVSGKGVFCLRCHNEIVHERKPVDVVRSRQDCRGCHAEKHDVNGALYAGTIDGHNQPSAMFKSRIECKACHDEKIGGRPDQGACRRCHQERIGGFLANWKAQIEQGRQAIGENVKALESVDKSPAPTAAAAIARAKSTVETLANGRAIHNIRLARTMLLESNQGLRDAAVSAGKTVPRTMELEGFTTQSDQACVACHFGVERTKLVWKGFTFAHKTHALDNGIQCGECHKSAEGRHGQLTATEKSCKECHDPIPAAAK